MNGPLIDPMTGALAAVEHAAARPQARTKEAFAAALAMLSPELQAQFFNRVNKEANKCGLPTCEQMTLHRGGYCCKEHKAEHKRRLYLRDNPPPVKVEWCCKHAVGAPYWQGTEIFESDECGHTFETMEERQDVIDGRIYANCPRCQGELDKYDADWDKAAI